MSDPLWILLIAKVHLAEALWLEQQLNMGKLQVFWAGILILTVSGIEGLYLVPLQVFIKNKAFEW